MQEEQARQAKQIEVLESERVAQELLLQEKGAQIKVIFLLCISKALKMCKSQVHFTFWKIHFGNSVGYNFQPVGKVVAMSVGKVVAYASKIINQGPGE